MDGSEVVPGMEELTQPLIATATAATQAVQAASNTPGGGAAPSTSEKKDLARLIPRPGTFHPVDREQEILQCRDWFWSLKQYLVVVDSSFQDELAKIEEKSGDEVEWERRSRNEPDSYTVCWGAWYRAG